MTEKVAHHDKHPATEVRCSNSCGWTATLSDFDLDAQGNFVLPVECPDCDDGYTYIPDPTRRRDEDDADVTEGEER